METSNAVRNYYVCNIFTIILDFPETMILCPSNKFKSSQARFHEESKSFTRLSSWQTLEEKIQLFPSQFKSAIMNKATLLSSFLYLRQKMSKLLWYISWYNREDEIQLTSTYDTPRVQQALIDILPIKWSSSDYLTDPNSKLWTSCASFLDLLLHDVAFASRQASYQGKPTLTTFPTHSRPKMSWMPKSAAYLSTLLA